MTSPTDGVKSAIEMMLRSYRAALQTTQKRKKERNFEVTFHQPWVLKSLLSPAELKTDAMLCASWSVYLFFFLSSGPQSATLTNIRLEPPAFGFKVKVEPQTSAKSVNEQAELFAGSQDESLSYYVISKHIELLTQR